MLRSTTWHSRTPPLLRPAEKPSGTLSEKRLYVYRKTPKRFYKNALTFSLKRKYVLLQTQGRFSKAEKSLASKPFESQVMPGLSCLLIPEHGQM